DGAGAVVLSDARVGGDVTTPTDGCTVDARHPPGRLGGQLNLHATADDHACGRAARDLWIELREHVGAVTQRREPGQAVGPGWSTGRKRPDGRNGRRREARRHAGDPNPP